MLIAGGIAAYAGRNAIAERLYERALDQSVGVDQSLALGEALVLYHLVPSIPAGPMEGLFLSDADSRFDGKLEVGGDGLLVSLPADGQNIRFDQAL